MEKHDWGISKFDNCIYLFKSDSSNIFFFSYPRQSKAKCAYAQL